MKKILTLCLAYRQPKVLLAMKKRGFGAGKWNGLGGKLNPGETIEVAAIRESREEAGIEVQKMEKIGILDFEFKGNPEIMNVHIFRVDSFSGEPVETEEMKPQWFDTSELPFKNMWPDDEYWFPLFLAGKKFTGEFLFDENNVILEHELSEVKEI